MPKPGPGPRCGIERTHRLLDDAGSETLELLLGDYEQHGWTDAAIARAVAALLAGRAGAPDITWSIVKAHRQRKCRCSHEENPT